MMWMIFFFTSFVLGMVFLFLGVLFSKIQMTYRNFISPLECGFNTMTEMRYPISLRFFIYAVIFVVFDVELILVIPFMFFYSWSVSTIIVFYALVVLLSVGLFIEWNNKALEWLA